MSVYAIDNVLIEWDERRVLAELNQLKKEAGISNASVSLDFNEPKDVMLCAVCRQTASSKCQSCLGVSYCCRDHQKAHWKVHRPYCVLHEVVEDPINGSYLVAKHNIKKGEAIFVEEPYFVTPFSQDENFDLLKFQPLSKENKDMLPMGKYARDEYIANNPPIIDVCVCCFLYVPPNHSPCVDCGWLTCGHCDQLPIHAMLECEYFKSKKIMYGECQQAAVIVPKFLGVIRAILLKRKEPKKWEILCDENNQKIWADKVKADVKLRMNAEYFYITLQQVFKFEDLTYSEVSDVLRVIDIMTFYGCMCNDDGEKIREYAGAYNLTSLIRHRCVGNVLCIQTHPPSMHVVAGKAIKKGEILCRTLNFNGQILRGTERQQLAMSLTNKLCECPYCTDPTKQEESLSAIMCLKCKRRGFENYMTPVNTMVLDTAWSCQKCGAQKTFLQVQRLFAEASKEFQFNDDFENPIAMEQRLRSALYKYKRESVFHCGHSIILSAENDVIFLMLHRLQYLTLEETEYLLQLITTRIKALSKFVPELHTNLVALKMRMAQALLHRCTRIPLRGQQDVLKALTDLQEIYDDIAKGFVEQSKKNALQSHLLACLRNLRNIIGEVGTCYYHQRQMSRRALKLPSKYQL